MRKDAASKTLKYFNLDIYRKAHACGSFDVSQIQKTKIATGELQRCELVAFDKALTGRTRRASQILHFYLHDFFFERIWRNPEKYLGLFKQYRAIIMPDFSLWTDMPKAVQIYNRFRANQIARFYQDHGVTVIPSPAWGETESYTWCFDGMPAGGTFAICARGADAELFSNGLAEFIRRCRPDNILALGNTNTVGVQTVRAKYERGKGGYRWVIQEPAD